MPPRASLRHELPCFPIQKRLAYLTSKWERRYTYILPIEKESKHAKHSSCRSTTPRVRHTFQTTSHSHLPSFLCLQQPSIQQNHIYTSNSPWTTTNPIITMATSNTTMQVQSILPHNQALTCSKPQLIYLHAGKSFSSTPTTRFQPSALAPGKASPVKSAIRC